MAITGLTGAPVHSGSWLGLPDFGVTEKAQGTQSTSPQTDWGTLWNKAWNEGYNQANSTANPYSGQAGGGYDIGNAFTVGQQAYKNAMPSSANVNPVVVKQNTGDSPTTSGDDSGGGTDAEAQRIMSQISGGYDAYLANLNEMFNSGLGAQKASQDQIVQNSLASGLSSLGTQKELGMADLGAEETKVQQNQVKNFKDISSNIRNLMQAGNTYLGSMGAGDSSAVNQYAYGLTKLGSQQRGDVTSQTANLLNEIGGRKFKLGTIYNDEVQKLQTDAGNKLLQVQSEFNDKQNEIRLMIANGELSKASDLASMSKTILDQSIARANQVNTEMANRRATLETWAMSNSQTLAQLQANLQKVSEYTAPNQKYGQITGTPNLQNPLSYNPYGGSSYGDTDDDLFS
jgi:hypothetical protein